MVRPRGWAYSNLLGVGASILGPAPRLPAVLPQRRIGITLGGAWTGGAGYPWNRRWPAEGGFRDLPRLVGPGPSTHWGAAAPTFDGLALRTGESGHCATPICPAPSEGTHDRGSCRRRAGVKDLNL